MTRLEMIVYALLAAFLVTMVSLPRGGLYAPSTVMVRP